MRGCGNTFRRAAAYNKSGWVMHMDNNGGAAELMPGKKPQSRAVRFCPPHK